jgi:Na+-transporting methylmalonyl-CoA/oxaloacetate decarboxylase gamma subunit
MEMLEIIGLLFRGINTFQLGLGIVLIVLSLKDIDVSNLR